MTPPTSLSAFVHPYRKSLVKTPFLLSLESEQRHAVLGPLADDALLYGYPGDCRRGTR
jgi:hypothetical protein